MKAVAAHSFSVIVVVAGLMTVVRPPAEAQGEARGAQYFPPPETQDGWRSLSAPNATPSAADKARVRELAGLDWDRLHDAWEYVSQFEGPNRVLIIRHGWIAGEWFTNSGMNSIASCTKSLTALAVARLCELSAEGKLKKSIAFDSPAWKYLPPSWGEAEPLRKAITIRHLLTMSSGLDPYDGPYDDLDNYTELILSRGVEAEPGAVWAYSSAGVDLLSLIVEDVSGQLLGDFFNEQIAGPIGSAPLQFPKFGAHSGGSGGPRGGPRVTPRDFARLGYLLLHEGRWNGADGPRQILQPETVRLVTQWAPQLESSKFRLPNLGSPKPDAQLCYGYLFWTNRTQERLGRAVPRETFFFSGWGKQACIVIPSLNMVIVRLGPIRELNERLEFYPEFLSRIMAGVLSEEH